MTANLKTNDLVEACITMLNAAIGSTITFAPVLIQEGDLSFFIENDDLTDDLPAIFVQSPNVRINIGDGSPTDIGGHIAWTTTDIRIVIIGQWDHGDQVVDKRQSWAEEVAQVFIGGAGDAYDLGGASISGYDIIHALPTGMEMVPPESAAVSLLEERQLFAVAVTMEITGRSVRV